MMFKKIRLKNGLRIILAPMAGARSATVLVLVQAGSKYETKDKNGISHFLEHLFFKGTKRRPTTLEIASELDSVGGSYNAFTSEEYTGYYVKVDAPHLDLALDIVSDIFLNSKLSQKDIEKERRVIVEEINMRQDVPMSYVFVLWNRLLYGDQPAGWDVIGTKETVMKLEQPDFIDYLKKHYLASKTIVCVAGRKERLEQVADKIKEYFKKIPSVQLRAKPAVLEKQSKPQLVIYFKKTDQCHLILGVRGYHALHKDRFALSLLSIILGGYMSSRLWLEIREKRGLAYYIHAVCEFATDTGFFGINAGIDNKRIEEAIKTILAEFKNVSLKGVTTKELIKAKNYVKGSTHLALESSDSVADFLAGQEVIKEEILTPEQFFNKIDDVSRQDIKRVAKDIFRPEKLNLALIGPFRDKNQLELILKL